MKKILLLSVMFMMFSLTACSKSDTGGENGKTKKSAKTKSAAKLSEQEITDALAEVIGESDAWQAEFLSNLKKNMSCADVKKIYPDLECAPDEEYDFPEVTVKGNKIVSGIKFTFKSGKLSSATIQFKSKLKKDLFKKLSLAAFEAKWGEVKAEDKNEDILTAANSKYNLAQRNYMVDHWEISNDIVAK